MGKRIRIGHVWKQGYDSDELKSQCVQLDGVETVRSVSQFDACVVAHRVYEDVVRALERWTDNGRKAYIYSSGSIPSQKLLFAHSDHGDLTRVCVVIFILPASSYKYSDAPAVPEWLL